ncbi:hypothetical protein PHJA_000162900 [Phtheirospermum japonicum]|uniref:Myb/SANT-like DNA-binding domain-containing protein n=1 Tax=Phtheirospermum japonicum TaxID=374723 RepID=A0A830B7V6_9LAMI|nr:hypothetical protein PHJA_000162900 [Phtheirospermum japonicum]
MLQGNNNGSYVGFDLQIPVRVHHHQQQPFTSHHHQHNPRHGSSSSSILQPTIPENFPLTIGTTNQENPTLSLTDYTKSDDDEPSFNEETENTRNDPGKVKKSTSSPWQRVKWTDAMVRLLITAVSYITEESGSEYIGGPRRKYSNLQKKGKWKSVSKVMAERGHLVSPQQCEDKFNDLNKRYKRLNEILGRGTSCEVVENPTLLDVMDHIPEKAKDEVRKILSSKHLHYEEMCSYHNGNRLHLPPDPDLQNSLRLALRNRDDHDDMDVKRHLNSEENDEVDDQDQEEVDFEDNCSKRVKRSMSHEDFSFKNQLGSLNCERVLGDGTTRIKNRASDWNIQLEEQRLHIDAQMLELEKEKFKWQRFCRKKDRELEMTRMEIERMKLENERMALELRRKEMGIDEN